MRLFRSLVLGGAAFAVGGVAAGISLILADYRSISSLLVDVGVAWLACAAIVFGVRRGRALRTPLEAGFSWGRAVATSAVASVGIGGLAGLLRGLIASLGGDSPWRLSEHVLDSGADAFVAGALVLGPLLVCFAIFALAIERAATDKGVFRLAKRWALTAAVVFLGPPVGLRVAGELGFSRWWFELWGPTRGYLSLAKVGVGSVKVHGKSYGTRYHHCCTDAFLAIDWDLDGDGSMDCREVPCDEKVRDRSGHQLPGMPAEANCVYRREGWSWRAEPADVLTCPVSSVEPIVPGGTQIK